MRRYLLLLLIPFGLVAQGTPVDCTPGTFTFTSATAGNAISNANSSTPCRSWEVSYNSTGFSALSIQFETSPDNSTWTAVPNSICTPGTTAPPCVIDGANPSTDVGGGTWSMTAYARYVRLNVTSVTGSGTITARVYGYKGLSARNAAGGGGGGGGTPGAPVNSIQFNNPLGTFAGDANWTWVAGTGATARISDATDGSTDSPARPLIAAHVTSATPIEVDTGLAGFSAGVQWQMTDASGTLIPVMNFDCLWRKPSGFQTCAPILRAIDGGSLLPMMILDDWNGNFTLGSGSWSMLGSYNTAFGGSALSSSTGNDNTAVGYQALVSASSASRNTAIGKYALLSNQTGTGNTAVGAGACGSQTGAYNLCLGYFADVSAESTNEMVIGINMTGNGPNTATYGNSSITDSFVAGRISSGTLAFASLGTPADSARVYCSDCTVTSGIDNTCAGSGSGAFALRINGAWKCTQ